MTSSATTNGAQSAGLDAKVAAAQVIELAQQTPAPTRGVVGPEAADTLRTVRTATDAEMDRTRLEMIGLASKPVQLKRMQS